MNKLRIGFFMSFGALVLLSILFYDEKSMLREEKLSFHVLESNELYFKNLKQYYYDRSFREDAQVELFRLRSKASTAEDVELHFSIVCNWLDDQAYILPQVSGNADSLEYTVLIVTDDTARFDLGLSNHFDNLQFAFVFYHALLMDESLFYIKTEIGLTPLVKSNSERVRVKQVLKDYFKLTGAL